MKNTEQKLNESNFFLDKLKQTQGKHPEFDYYLNAYVSSARSVLWIMKSEYNSIPNWQEWYNNKETTPDEDKLLKGIVDMRNRSLKIEPLHTNEIPLICTSTNKIDLYSELHDFLGDGKHKVELNISTYDTKIPKEEEGIKKTTTSITFSGKLSMVESVSEFRTFNIYDKCNEYFEWLKNIVDECIKNFG